MSKIKMRYKINFELLKKVKKIGHCLCNPKLDCPCDDFLKKGICKCSVFIKDGK